MNSTTSQDIESPPPSRRRRSPVSHRSGVREADGRIHGATPRDAVGREPNELGVATPERAQVVDDGVLRRACVPKREPTRATPDLVGLAHVVADTRKLESDKRPGRLARRSRP